MSGVATGKTPRMHFRAEVRFKIANPGEFQSGLFVYFATMQEAANWVADWPNAIWAHIEQVPYHAE